MARNEGSLDQEQLLATIAELQARLASVETQVLRNRVTENATDRVVPIAAEQGKGNVGTATDAEVSFGRRSLLRRAGLVAAGAAAATVASGALQPAAAATGSPVNIGELNLGSTNTPQTTLKVTSLDSGAAAMFAVTDGTTVSSSRKPTFIGLAGGSITNTGVAGVANGASSVGVLGQSSAGVAIAAASNSTHLKLTDATGNITSLPSTSSIMSRLALPGEIIYDGSGNLWVGTTAAVGAYRKLGGFDTAGSLHTITPARVYDSRAAAPAPGSLASGANRTINVADARNTTTGAVVTSNIVPAGARAIAYNLTITNTVNSGFLAVNPGGNTTVAASAINWSASGDTVANGSVVALNGSRQISVICGGTGATDFIVDIVGYYM